MKRTTISLPDDLADALGREARRRHSSVSEVAREAIAVRLGKHVSGRRDVPFAALGRNEREENVAERGEEILAAEWAEVIARDSGLRDQ